MKIKFVTCTLVSVLSVCSIILNAQPKSKNEDGSYTNPVFDFDFPDPNLIKAKDGYYYAYSTQANWTKRKAGGPYITPIIRSKNLINWTFVKDGFLKKPDWKTEGGIWAPDATYYKGKYYLYYSVSIWDDPNPGIGLAIADKPEGPFTDYGKLFLSKEINVKNSIDPFLMLDNGKPYLFWGSFNGVYGVPLSPDGKKISGDKFLIAGNAYEGTYIFKKNNYYYFLGSIGTCCALEKSTYKVLAGRSLKLEGPYMDADGKPLTNNGGTLVVAANKGDVGFIGTGHNGDIFTDDEGKDWMFYHAYKKSKPTDGRIMLLDELIWENGWPAIKDKQPSTVKTKGPVFN